MQILYLFYYVFDTQMHFYVKDSNHRYKSKLSLTGYLEIV